MQVTEQFLHMLIADSEDVGLSEAKGGIEIPVGEADRKRMIRSLMNIRGPRKLSEELLRQQDAYLRQELERKGIVEVSEIPTVREQYGVGSPFGDKLSLWQGDITRLKVGAIVNAANSGMLGCFVPCHGCIDNAIHSGAGMQLRDECSKIMDWKRGRYGGNYEEPVGTATLTKGYNLPCDYVIHTVGPIVYGTLTKRHRADLASCYRSVLHCAWEHKIESVAFCCISTGEFHFPGDEAARIAVNTVNDFLTEFGGQAFARIIFNVFKDEDKVLYEKMLGQKGADYGIDTLENL